MGPLCYIITCRTHWLRDLGGALSPFNAFLFLQGLETLHLRMPRHCENALAVAKFLEAHPLVTWVNYPGPAVASRLRAGARSICPRAAGRSWASASRAAATPARKFIEVGASSPRTWPTSATPRRWSSTRPRTTHSQQTPEELQAAGVTDDYVRVSVGLEDVEDIIADLDQALKASQE